MSTKTRKSNGQGHTYKVGKSWKTVITSQGRTVTATAKTQQESEELELLYSSIVDLQN